MFEFLKDLAGAPLVATDEYYMTNSEAVTRGEALYFSSGRLTKAVGGSAVAAIAMQTKAAGTDVKVKVALVTATQIWRVGYTGTPDVAFIVGQNAADIDTTGLLINAADVTGGAFAIMAKNTTNTKVDVMVKNRQLN